MHIIFIDLNSLLNMLIVGFIILIVSQMYIHFDINVEGMENDDGYQEYGDDPLILAKQNAGNIKVLRQKVDDMTNIKDQVDSMQTDLNNANEQIQDMMVQQQELASEISGGEEPHEISGTA